MKPLIPHFTPLLKRPQGWLQDLRSLRAIELTERKKAARKRASKKKDPLEKLLSLMSPQQRRAFLQTSERTKDVEHRITEALSEGTPSSGNVD